MIRVVRCCVQSRVWASKRHLPILLRDKMTIRSVQSIPGELGLLAEGKWNEPSKFRGPPYRTLHMTKTGSKGPDTE